MSGKNKKSKADSEKAKTDDSSRSSTTADIYPSTQQKVAARTSNRAAENLQKIDAQQQQQKRIGEQPKQVRNKKENADTSQNV